jgi:hypothetical protein
MHMRYDRPVFLAETRIEGEGGGSLSTVTEEVREAIRAGVSVEGICVYRVLSHPGWRNGRMCPNGLLEMQRRHDRRPVHEPLAAELRRHRALNDAVSECRSRHSFPSSSLSMRIPTMPPGYSKRDPRTVLI